MAIGERLFLNNCATCHGSDARGSKGFPNLTDADWLYGGTPEKIEETITHGRSGTMPPMAAAVGSADDVRNVAQLRAQPVGQPAQRDRRARPGAAKFAACAACHGVDGKGNPALGAPNLADKVWLHGWGEDAIVAMVNQRQDQRHAGARRAADARADPRARGLRLEPVADAADRIAAEAATMTDRDSARRLGRSSRSSPPPAAARLALREARRRSSRARCSGWFAGWRWALVWFTQLLFYGLPWLHVERPPGGAVRPGGAALLHLRPGPVSAGLHLPRRRC